MSTLAIGKTLLGGKYRIERVLGQGGFGITYLACHTMLDKRVAIKEFFPQSFCNRDSSTSRVVLGTLSAAELVERFRLKFIKEARNISRLSHSAIVQIHDIFEENDTAYYVMDYIEGESLSALVRREGPLASARALHLVRCVGDALSYIHGLKMNHLDVKPANIMLSQATGQPTLIDFGLAKQYDEGGHQTTSTPVGISHGYAPMEQYNIGGVSLFSPETDIYALGATLYYLLSGETPTEAPKLINEELTFPATIPANLVAPIRRAMSPAKRDRYSSVADFLQALETPAALADEPETSFDEPAVEATVVDETPKSTPQPTPKPAPQPKPQPAPQSAPQSAAVKENPITPTPKKKGSKKWLWTVVILLLVAGGFWGGRTAMTHLREQQAIADSITLAEQAAEQDTAIVLEVSPEAEQTIQATTQSAEQERLAQEKVEKDKAEKECLAEEKAAKEQAEKERLAEEKAAKEKAEEERLAAEKAERERLAAEQAAKEKAEKERREREARETAEKAEREQLAREAANKTYKVGDYYNVNGKEGVVFYVDASGKHDKIVSLTQSRGKLQWSSNESEQKRLIGASSKTNGAANMQAVQQRPNWRTDYPAFAWCANLGSGWYLPAIEELKLFTLNKSVHDAVNRTLATKGGTRLYNKRDSGKWYCSSTEENRQYSDGEFGAWSVSMIGVHTNRGSKYGDGYVRAVSAF